MFSKRLFTSLFALSAALARITTVFSSPVGDYDFGSGLDDMAQRVLARATPAAPHFLVYSDKGTQGITGPPPPSQVKVSIRAHIVYHHSICDFTTL